jgi:hypothetical protein
MSPFLRVDNLVHLVAVFKYQPCNFGKTTMREFLFTEEKTKGVHELTLSHCPKRKKAGFCEDVIVDTFKKR